MDKIHAPNFVRALLDHNRYTTIAAILSAVVLLNVFGCQPRTTSPVTGKHVTRDQLDAEIEVKQIELNAERLRIDAEKDAAINILKSKYSALGDDAAKLNAMLGPPYAELERKQAAITSLLQTAQGVLNQSGTPVTGVLATVLGLAAAGYGFDNRRKDVQIERKRLDDPTVAGLEAKLATASRTAETVRTLQTIKDYTQKESQPGGVLSPENRPPIRG